MPEPEQPYGPACEVWLTQDNMLIRCMIVREDESTADFPIDSMTMRGAQREVAGDLIRAGYEPAGRWKYEAEDQAMRRFKADGSLMTGCQDARGNRAKLAGERVEVYDPAQDRMTAFWGEPLASIRDGQHMVAYLTPKGKIVLTGEGQDDPRDLLGVYDGYEDFAKRTGFEWSVLSDVGGALAEISDR